MIIDKAVIYEAKAADPKADRIVRSGPLGKLTIVPLPDAGDVVTVALELVAAGTRLIELCGGMPLPLRAAVLAAVGDRAQVSSITFGIESLLPAAAYNAAFLAGTPQREAFIIFDQAAGPGGERLVRAYPPQNTTLAFVPDPAAAVATARELIADGVSLIELYGGFTTQAAAAVITAVDGKAPVGVGAFAYDKAAVAAA